MKFLKTLILSIIFFSFCQVSQAQNCNSWGSVASDLANNTKKWLQQQGCSAASFLAYTPLKIVGSKQKITNGCQKFFSLHTSLVRAQRRYWNQEVGNTWAAQGPRNIDVGVRQSGTIVSTTGRMFVNRTPTIEEQLQVKIKEQGGKGKTSITVCVTDINGHTDNVGTIWFNDSKSSKKRSGEVKTLNIDDAYGKIVTLHFDGKSVGNTFRYDVELLKR